jgi:glycosyl transferase family 2
MNKPHPRVTVAMSAYNAASTVREAVASILWQDMSEWELIIAEDGSTDDTARVLESIDDHRIHILADGGNRGKPARMNQIIKLARAPLMAIMDADDIAYPKRLGMQVEHLEAYPHIDLLASGMATFDECGRLGRWRRLGIRHNSIVRHPWLGFHFNSPTWVGRTSWFRQFGYREDLRAAEDEDLLLRSHRSSHFAGLPDILQAYRIDQWTLSKARRMRRDHIRALVSDGWTNRDPRHLAGIAMHIAKFGREIAAVVAGGEQRLLDHRALPLEPSARMRLKGLLRTLALARFDEDDGQSAPGNLADRAQSQQAPRGVTE